MALEKDSTTSADQNKPRDHHTASKHQVVLQLKKKQAHEPSQLSHVATIKKNKIYKDKFDDDFVEFASSNIILSTKLFKKFQKINFNQEESC